MPSGLHSTHICRTIINSAALLEEEKPSAGVGCVADMEAVAMKAPLLAFRWGWAALPISHVARVLIANILSNSARPRSTSAPPLMMPALQIGRASCRERVCQYV